MWDDLKQEKEGFSFSFTFEESEKKIDKMKLIYLKNKVLLFVTFENHLYLLHFMGESFRLVSDYFGDSSFIDFLQISDEDVVACCSNQDILQLDLSYINL